MNGPVSITLPQFTRHPAAFLDAARLAEELGYANVFLFDHLVPVGNPDRPVLEGASALGAVAAATRRIGVGTLVLRAGLRGPGLSAAVASAAEAISGPRLTIGLGAADRLSNEEAVRFGMRPRPLDERLETLAETVTQIRRLASSTRIWIGGRNEAVRSIAAELADGWNAWDASPDQLAAESEMVRRLAERSITISWGGPVRMDIEDPRSEVGRLRQLLAAGADHLVVSVLPNAPASWRRFAELWDEWGESPLVVR